MTESDFPKHKISLTLSHNDHKSVYEPIEEYLSHSDMDWVSEEQKQKAIDEDSIWEIQWYPNTPVGFLYFAACDLNVLLAHVKDME